jgi:2'-5' RNA ligase
MTNHWDRPGWVPGHRAYYWMLTFPGEQELIAEALHCQGHLDSLGLDPVPPDGLHLTMAKIGNVNDFTPGVIDKLAVRAAAETGAGFSMGVYPLTGSRGAVRFSVAPWAPLVGLYEALTRVNRSAGLSGGRATTAFRPHLGIAYNNRDRSAAPVIEQVSLLRGRPALALRIGTVDLVELRREGTAYRWDVLHRVPLTA